MPGRAFVFVVWYDQSGNINDAPQATAADQPLLDAVDTHRIIFNGQRTGTSDGGQKSKALTLPNTVSLSRQAVSAFAVVRPTVSYNNNILFQLGINPQTIVFTAGSAGVFGLRAAHSTLITTVIPPPSSFDDGLIDYAARAEFSDPTNVTYFLDGLHPTDVGHAIRATMTGTAISAIL